MLYVVATPIGNLGDITLRALESLKAADFIIAENPGHTAKLLQHFEIAKKPFVQFADHNEQKILPVLLKRLATETACLVSDAGTPGISDPGFRLVRGCVEQNIQVTPIPGASAIITALSASGLPTDSFTFLGFVPKTEIKLIDEITKGLGASSTVVFYESPQRILKTLGYISKNLPDIHITITRELTKIHEEFIRGDIHTVIESLTKRGSIRGEFVVLVSHK